MRFVAVKSEEVQVIAAIHRVRDGCIKERTAAMSQIGAILLEFDLSFPKRHAKMKSLFQWLAEQKELLPESLLGELVSIHEHYKYVNERVKAQDSKLQAVVNNNESAPLLKTIPRVGDPTSTLCIADVSSSNNFTNGREMAAWLWIVPRQF